MHQLVPLQLVHKILIQNTTFAYILQLLNIFVKQNEVIYLKEVYFNLKDVRKKKKLTQVELADKSGILQQNISNYETGYKSPTLESAVRLADALGVTLDELVIIRDAKEQIAQKYKKLIKSKK